MPHEVRLPFRPKARLLQLLGDHLIGTPRLAVFELVKNAYDADAREVVVTLDGIDSEEPRITIKDNGDGMTLDIIKNIWLSPGHNHREQQRRENRKTTLGRLPLGEKGVGRFAVHKLGDRIELVTRASGKQECVVDIDWPSLIDKPYLSDAEVSVQTRAPKIFTGEETGTRLVITQLREKEWSRGEVRRMLRQVTSISSPFSTGVDNFAVTLEVPDHPEWLQGIPDIPTLLNRAPWHFEFTFNNGRFEWKYEFRGIPKVKVEPRTKKRTAKNSEPLQLPLSSDTDEFGNEQGARKARPRSVIATKETGFGLGAIHGEFYVFDRDRDILLNLGDVAFVKNVLDENGGVRIYRDGIRVYNFGESGDDWLGLDLRRVNSPTKRVSRNIILGAIELSLKDTCKSLTEKTNREGFIENDAYRRLRQVVLGALSVMEIERDEDKNRIRIMTMKGSDHEVERIQKPLDELRAAAKAHKVDVVLAPYIKKIEKDYTEFRETMLRAGLSGLGLAVVFHEVERGVRVLYESIDRGQKIEALKKQAQGLVRVLDGFSELLRKGDARKQSLKHLLQSARDINSVRLRTHGIRLVCPALDDPTPDQGVVFAFNLALGALNNLIDNAIHWLKVRWPDVDGKQSTRSIYLDINLKDFPEGPAIVVADNGPGFQDDPEHLIRPFFSRRPDGMGLGLYYTNLVMELSHGILVFPDPNDLGVPEIFDGAAIAMVFPGEKT